MRFIYIDEAGTAANEPVSIVAGVIVNGDSQYIRAEQALREVISDVPPAYQEDFYFHATAIWGHRKYRDEWSFERRLNFLHKVMAIPRALNIPVVFGAVRRDSEVPEKALKKMSQAQFHHIMAFSYCVGRADKYIRDYAASEVVTLVAEDIPEMRLWLTKTLRVLKKAPEKVTRPEDVRITEAEKGKGRILQDINTRVCNIRDAVHFANKGDSALLQLADACAFAFRRFLSDQEFGSEFVHSVIGQQLIRSEWDGPADASCFFQYPQQYSAAAAIVDYLFPRNASTR